MVNPVPGKSISTPYGRRGKSWSCNKNSQGGIHTGADWAAPRGTPIVAPIDGQIRHRSYGSVFGPNQFAISPDPGQPFGGGEVFFAHTLDRLPDGTRVTAGQQIARVGDLGNVTGPHLHMEYLPNSKGRWACGLHADPAPVVDWQPSAAPAPSGAVVYLSKLRQGQGDSDSVRHLQRVLNGHSLKNGSTLPVTGNFANRTAHEVRLCQQQHGGQWGEGQPDAMGKVSVGPKQAQHLFAGSGLEVRP